eukprot:COSAG05_NODE_8886_length_664_cov_1.345133_1_plen_205_part_01
MTRDAVAQALLAARAGKYDPYCAAAFLMVTSPGGPPAEQGWYRTFGQRVRAFAAADKSSKDARVHDRAREDGWHIWAKQRHELYAEKNMDTAHVHQTAASDRLTAYCLWAGGGALHGGHWLFLAAKAKAQRSATHYGVAQPRASQVVAAYGDEVAVFVEPPQTHLGCTLCGKMVAHDPAAIDFSLGRQLQPCTHSFCRLCLEKYL